MTSSVRSEAGMLAIDGGVPIRARAMPGWPQFDEHDFAAVSEVLASGRVNYWTGEQGRMFEKEFASWVGVPYGVAVTNGTVALELALSAVGIGPGDDVIVPATTFIGTASAVARCGAVPIVADVAPDNQCVTATTVEAALTPRTRAIIVVHVAGFPVDMPPLLDLAQRYGLRVVEDCAQAHGARRDGRMVGTFGDIAAWSFCQEKIMTTAGEGGAVTTSDEELWRKVWEAKDHGKSHATFFDRRHSSRFKWVHESFGTNARMTEVQAVIGRSQLRKVEGWLAQRRQHAALIRDALSTVPAVRLPPEPVGGEHAWYRFYLHIRLERLASGWDRDRVVAAVAAEGVPCRQSGCAEIYRERAFARIRPLGPLPVAAELGRTAFALCVHPTLTRADVRDTIDAVCKVARVAER